MLLRTDILQKTVVGCPRRILQFSAKDINKIKLPLLTTGGKSGYIITLIRICKPKWRENISEKVKVRFVTCYFRLVGGKLAHD